MGYGQAGRFSARCPVGLGHGEGPLGEFPPEILFQRNYRETHFQYTFNIK